MASASVRSIGRIEIQRVPSMRVRCSAVVAWVTYAVMRFAIPSATASRAGDVAQALKALDASGFDLLISDLGLPDQSGLDLMQELRQRGNALKGIALSGYGREEDMRRSQEAGFSVHLTKPVDADALVQAVDSML